MLYFQRQAQEDKKPHFFNIFDLLTVSAKLQLRSSVDPIRYGFMSTIMTFMEEFINKLPPLLQMLLGLGISLFILKILMMFADAIDKKREGE
ncbi:MAG: hypothetical protein VYC17_00645 [Nitrospinota bacterium]|nr:hypothetical protein [Nitrospinota bacterium]